MSTDIGDAPPPPPPPPPPLDYSIADEPVVDEGQAAPEGLPTSNADPVAGSEGTLAPADVPVIDDGQAPPEGVLTGARGPASNREFDPEKAGGPIQNLDAESAKITDEGVKGVEDHLMRFAVDGKLEAPEQGMLDRLKVIASGDMEPTSYDQNFYTHELREAERYAQLGFGPESSVDIASPEMYDVWNNVHTATLEDYGISGADLFHPDVKL